MATMKKSVGVIILLFYFTVCIRHVANVVSSKQPWTFPHLTWNIISRKEIYELKSV